jgi:hypothetical protein
MEEEREVCGFREEEWDISSCGRSRAMAGDLRDRFCDMINFFLKKNTFSRKY